MAATAVTGTIYGLTDPRDGRLRYIGQTKQTLKQRLGGHLGGNRSSPRVRAWVAELRAAGLRPQIAPIREGVPADGLNAAETDEITRILVAGGTLLNEQATAPARKILQDAVDAAREMARREAWAELAGIAMAELGGPLPPGEIPEVEIPAAAWAFMSGPAVGYAERIRALMEDRSDESRRRYARLDNERQEAGRALWRWSQGAWGKLGGIDESGLGFRLRNFFTAAAETSFASPADCSRYLALSVWYMTAVIPWRHLAELAGLSLGDASFIMWAGREDGSRDALRFLSGRGGLAGLSRPWWRTGEPGPGHLLGTIAAAYSRTAPEPISLDLRRVLEEMADDHMLTRPMADLLMRLNPRVLDSVFGPDIGVDIDRDFGLPAGTGGEVIRMIAKRLMASGRDPLRRAADRSAQALPVVDVPDYGTWHGPGVLPARVVSASLIRAGLAESQWMTAEEYVAEVRALWVPEPLARDARDDAA